MGVEKSAPASASEQISPNLAPYLLEIASLAWRQPIAGSPNDLLEGLEDWGAYRGTPPQIELLADGRKARLLRPISYRRPDLTEWPVPVGAQFDGASIPRVFWSLIGGPFEGRYRDASIVHDRYCDEKSRAWRDTHRMFHDAMRCSGVGAAQAKILFYAVYRFGPRWPEPGSESLVEPSASRDPAPADGPVLAADAEAIYLHDLDLDEIERLADARDMAAAAAREEGAEAPPNQAEPRVRLERARRLIVTGGRGVAEDLEAVAGAVARLPDFVFDRFERKGVRIIACRESVTDFEVDLRGVVPRGWEATGRTWDDVPGAYLDQRKRVVIGTVEQEGRRVVPDRSTRRHGSADLVVHESLHGFDYSGGHAVLREPRFVEARRKDVDRLDDYERQEGQAGLEETFAESGARFAVEPDRLRTDLPHLAGYWTVGPSTSEAPLLTVEAVEGPAALGVAEALPDGDIVLDLRAEAPGGVIGHAVIRLQPGEEAHERVGRSLSIAGGGPEGRASGRRLFKPLGQVSRKAALPGSRGFSVSQGGTEMAGVNPRNFIEGADVGRLAVEEARAGQLEATEPPPLNLDKLPPGIVSGTTLIDFSGVPNLVVRAGVSLSMLFASRVASAGVKPGDDEDDWLAAYTTNLGALGFSLAGSAVAHSEFKKTGVAVHKAIIPFLTIAFGGAAIGPIILAALTNLQEMDASAPWISLFDRETRRFNARELHFAAVNSNDTDTSIRYAIARLNVASSTTTILFFKLTNAEARFDSVTTTMSVNNSLMAVIEPDLRAKLGAMTQSFIKEAKLSAG